jgi:signal peptidase I
MNPQPDDKPDRLIPADIYPASAVHHSPHSDHASGESSPFPQPPAEPAPARHHLSHLPKGPKEGWHPVISTALLFLLAPVIALCIAAFVIQSYQVDGESMETTLQNSDRLIVDKLPRTLARITHHDYIPARGNIIIFNESGLPDSGPTGQKQLIKRVIGLPGERVVIQNGYITIYNNAHPRGFNPDKTTGYGITASTTAGDVDLTLGPNQLFVCGDNRTNSEDSRFFGPVDASQVVGRLVLRLLPASHLEKF